MRKIIQILSVSQHINRQNGKVYYKATILDDKGDESEGYLFGEGDPIEWFFNEKWGYAQFIIKPPKKDLH